MKRTLLAAALLGAGLLSACTMTGPGNLRVHEAVLYGGAQERVVWVYGTLQGSASSVKLGSQSADLRAQVTDPIATPGSLSVNGKATYREPTTTIPAQVTVTRQGSTFTVTPASGAQISAVYYTDGQSWTRLNGTSGTVGGTRVEGLKGAGQLTDDEARVLADTLRPQGPLAVAVLANQAAPALAVEPTPTEHLRSDLYILSSVPAAQVQPPRPLPGTPTTPTPGGNVTVTQIATGTNANTSEAGVQVAATASAASSLYARAYGRQSSVPTPPSVTGRTLIGVFLGQRPTGGYGVQVVSAISSGTQLTLRIRLTAPVPGAILAQVITSPWAIVSVPGSYTTVTVIDENGQPLPAATGSGQVR
ncbi:MULTISPECIES: protease complex subunit PrcB family protein [unclassified Deinococcus]|uniref:protease complex subunit PrcB family protein n=1 Tax=unclassified Deinococcus TaxID=2623546 RepID=UPI001C305237|nr:MULTISPECIES: protease complex subunit PrcB family protein [unclassified Deinococcus]MDK2013767.1 protease complex subunit PrcB family protein [Deinococcus sp. 43]